MDFLSKVIFQVVTGGHYDVDVIVQDPTKKVLYKEVKKQYDSFTFTAEVTGEYSACFSNEFSTFSHKLVLALFIIHLSNQLKIISPSILNCFLNELPFLDSNVSQKEGSNFYISMAQNFIF